MDLKVNKQQLGVLSKLRDSKGEIDLTGLNVQKLKDRKAKKILEPVLQEVLPRRQKGEQYSSYYRALRVQLLPYNPHFNQDVTIIRELFHIPEGHIATVDFKEPIAKGKCPWDKAARTAAAANNWMDIHRSAALQVELVNPTPVPRWFKQSASTIPNFSQPNIPDWLKKMPIIPNVDTTHLSVPLERCVAKLVERYQLPWLSMYNLRLFILTLRPKYLTEIFPYDIIIEPANKPIGMAYRITVDWIDEYTTEKEWHEIWQKAIVPRLEHLWEERGEYQHSKRIEIGNLTESWVIELYKCIFGPPRIGVDAALEKLSKSGKLTEGGIDRTTAYRRVKQLRSLMQPVD